MLSPIIKNKILIGPQYASELIFELEKVKKDISIIMYVWTKYPDDPFCDPSRITSLILDAHRRGLKVRILTNFSATCDWLCSLGLNARLIAGSRIVHAKMVILDSNKIFVGSHNFSRSAMTSNIEVSTLHTDFSDVDPLLRYFNSLWL